VGATAGVLLVGLVLGHMGFPNRPEAATFGFAIFIFSVGVQAGPSFFGALREDGRRFIALAAAVAGTAAILAAVLSRALDLEQGLGAGLLAGALTSTPTLAGAEDAVRIGIARLPEGMDAARATTNVSVGYAITYLFGTVGLIACIRFLPRILGIDLPAEARKIAEERGVEVRRRVVASAASLPVVRAYRVAEEAVGKTIEERRIARGRQVLPLRVRRGRELLDPVPFLEIEEGDIVSVVATVVEHRQAREQLGDEVLDPELIDFAIVTRVIVVS
jgi:putative transport protein